MSDEDENDWSIEDVLRRESRPFALPKIAGIRYAFLRGREVVETDDMAEWSKAFESLERIVEQTTVNRYFISTVFIGISSHPLWGGPPTWFETMVFEEIEGKSVQSSRFERHYATWAEARAGHESMVEIIRYGNF